jgi:hypothetical protein
VKYLIKSFGFTSTLFLWNWAFPGNGALTISLSAAESLVAGDVPTNFTDNVTILTRRYNMAGSWSRDVAACNIKDFGVVTQTMKSLARRLVEDEKRPNPHPGLVRALADAARSYVHALDGITGGSRGLELAVVESFTDLAAVRAPREPLTFHDSKTGLRIRRELPEVPPQDNKRGESKSDPTTDDIATRSPD